jgi:hypothetical protein
VDWAHTLADGETVNAKTRLAQIDRKARLHVNRDRLACFSTLRLH